MSLTIPQLLLNRVALAGAYDLYRQCPWIRFTSGRRTLAQQARAMACNAAVRRDFIGKTYKAGAKLQLIVNQHPEWETVEQLEHGLYDYMHDQMAPNELALLSRHMSGDAFDVLPIVGLSAVQQEQATTTTQVIRRLDGLDTFLTREAGLVRWHAQFTQSEAAELAEMHHV